MKKLTITVAGAVAALAVAGAAVAAITVVSPRHLNGWQPVSDSCTATQTNTGSHGFATGPGTPPAGRGSYRVSVGSNGGSNENIHSRVLDGRRLADITALRYWSYEAHFGSDSRAVYLRLAIDYTGNGDAEDYITFQPSDTSTVRLNTWQSWDALHGSWRSDRLTSPSAPYVTLSQYAARFPNARVASAAGGGLRLGAGCGGSAWSGFVGYLDAVTVGAASNSTNPTSPSPVVTPKPSPVNPTLSTTFDFEPAATPTRTPTQPTHVGPGKVAMCHNGHTIHVDKKSVAEHLRHGDTKGACGDSDDDHENG
jgi:hypothetical protein